MGTILKNNSATSAMFDMIVYVSSPYTLEHVSTQNGAIIKLNKALGSFYKRNPKWAAVNALYSFYNNPNVAEDSAMHKPSYKVLYGMAHTLMKSAQVHVVLRTPGWEYSDIVMNECACAAQCGVPTVFEDI